MDVGVYEPGRRVCPAPSIILAEEGEAEELMLVMRPSSTMTVRFLWREWPSKMRALVIAILLIVMNGRYPMIGKFEEVDETWEVQRRMRLKLNSFPEVQKSWELQGCPFNEA
jgi:hypothetical protein